MHPIYRRFTVYCATYVAGAAATIGAAAAGEPRLSVAEGSACAVDAGALERQISSALIGTPDPELRVDLNITRASRITARIRLLRGARALGSKELSAATCEEALDTVVAVVALALSTLEPSRTERSSAPPASSARATVKLQGAPDPPRAIEHRTERSRVGLAHAAADHTDAASWRWLVAAGADHGSLAEPTVVLRVGTVLPLGPGDLRGSVWYGVPSAREEIGEALERTRSDFGSLALDYCLNLAGSGWLAACGGLEAGARRFARLELRGNQQRSEAARIDPTLTAAAGLAFAYRGVFVQPALDLSTQVPIIGAVQSDAPFGYRAVFGAAVPF